MVMEKTRLRFVRCPYCGQSGGHQHKVSKSVGVFRVRELYDNMELRECMKCKKVHAIRKIGKPLLWEDIPPIYRDEWKKGLFEDYKDFPEYKETDRYVEFLKWRDRRDKKFKLNQGGKKHGKKIQNDD